MGFHFPAGRQQSSGALTEGAERIGKDLKGRGFGGGSSGHGERRRSMLALSSLYWEDKAGRPERLGAGGSARCLHGGSPVPAGAPAASIASPVPRRPPEHTALLTLKPPVLREGCSLWLLFADDP